jgi:hypothetical protein
MRKRERVNFRVPHHAADCHSACAALRPGAGQAVETIPAKAGVLGLTAAALGSFGSATFENKG